MEFRGKLIGALIGSFAGPLGTILGGLIGHLFDKAREERISTGDNYGLGVGYRADPVSRAQVNFISSLVGLSMTVANIDGHVKVTQVEELKRFFRDNLPFAHDDQMLLQKIIDETFKNRTKLDIGMLCGYYRSVSTYEGRLLLVQLLFKIAGADTNGITTPEEELIRRISLLLGLDGAAYSRIRAEFIHEDARAYKILGVSKDAAVEDIKSAYRKLAAENHPDKVANLGGEFIKLAEEKFKVIQEAYQKIREERNF